MYHSAVSSSPKKSSICSLYMVWLLGICTFIASLFTGNAAFAQSSEKIINQIEQIKKDTFQKQLQKADFSTTPDYISIRIYKDDAELEVWAGHNENDPLTRLAVYPICDIGFDPGTKLIEGDKRTPEGSFTLNFYNNSKNWFMHINLSPAHIDEPGNVKNPAFYACTDYPTSFDKKLSGSIGIKNPGSAICLHGNCTSMGCASMENHDFIEIYYWMIQHDSQKYGVPRVHILPFRFYEPCKETPDPKDSSQNSKYCPSVNNNNLEYVASKTARHSKELKLLGKDKIIALWKSMRDRELGFLKNPTPSNAELNLSMDILDGMEESPQLHQVTH